MQHRFIIAVGIAVACTACSQQHEGGATAPVSASSTSPIASRSSEPALATTSATPSGLTYLYDLMRRPDFSSAFAALSGADQLPLWATQGGVATPAQQVVVDGHTLLLATACKPHDCPSERILILYDESTHAMSGVFARHKVHAVNKADSNGPANDDLIWLGAPDEASKQVLQRKLYSRD